MNHAARPRSTGFMGPDSRDSQTLRTPGEVFTTFLKLGLTSFGGPIAHLGYFREVRAPR